MNQDAGSVITQFTQKTKRGGMVVVLTSVLIVLAGVGSGWLLAGNKIGSGTSVGPETEVKNTVNTSDEAGVADESQFKNSESPIGILQEGGTASGEGQYHLERPGGESQNVYLTSTVIDLKSFVGKKVQVWGDTLSSQKAGWLMDVGKIKVVK